MSKLSKALGIKIREKRRFIGMTQENLASMIGVEAPTVSRWESGEFVPSEDKIDRVAEVLNLNFSEVIDPGPSNKKAELLFELIPRLSAMDERELDRLNGFIDDLIDLRADSFSTVQSSKIKSEG